MIKKHVLLLAPADMMLLTTGDGDSYEFSPGGGSMVAMTLAKWGMECDHMAPTGTDYMGKVLRHAYAQLHIDQRFLKYVDGRKTGLHLISGREDGRRRAYYPLVSDYPTPSDVEEGFMCMPDALYLEEKYPEEVIDRAFAYAKEKNIPVFFRANGTHGINYRDKRYPIHTLILNERDACTLSGLNTYSISNVAISLSIRIRAKYYMIDLGHRGVYLYDGSTVKTLFPPRSAALHDAQTVLSALTGAYIAMYLNTENAEDACEIATYAAGLAGNHPGGADAIPSLQKTMAYMTTRSLSQDE